MINSNLPIFEYGSAICYSGYRKSQNPKYGVYPSYSEIEEDLKLLVGYWDYIRLYDCGEHAKRVLEVIDRNDLDLRVMLGADIKAELNNPECPWGKPIESATLKNNANLNEKELTFLIDMARCHSNVVFAVSVGNETTAPWTDHKVSVERMIEFAKVLKAANIQPVTFCEGYEPWMDSLQPLAEILDFISIHTYPIWENKSIEEALEHSMNCYYQVAEAYPDKQIIITEAGWTTESDGQRIYRSQANEDSQALYCSEVLRWSEKAGILNFIFEAFDEPWKGSQDPREPEKHWGLFKEDRTPKKVLRHLRNLKRAGELDRCQSNKRKA